MNTLQVVICCILIAQLVGCGTIMYPERKGQKGGKIDAGVAVLDGIGLLFFLIPGVIAFAVDFNNGTIYLPGTFGKSADQMNIREVKFDAKKANTSDLEMIIKKETGYEVKFDQDNMKVSTLKSVDDVSDNFLKVLPGIQNTRIALLIN